MKISFIGVTAMVAVIGAAAGLQAQSGSTSERLLSALPSASGLAGFQNHQGRSNPKNNSAQVTATRNSDGLMFYMDVFLAPDIDTARGWLQSMADQPTGPMPAGSPSGRKVGEEIRHSGPTGESPRGSYRLLARDGRCVITLQLMRPPVKSKQTRRIEALPIAGADLTMAEGLLVGTISRLASMGYGSGERR